MKAVIFDGALAVREVSDPQVGRDDVLIRVEQAGICNTDVEITRGYVPGFYGIPGHEFWGYAENAPDLVKTRVTAEINCACGACSFCRQDLGRHCLGRTVIGIIQRSGALARYIAVPRRNVVKIPDEVPETSAILIEPLAAALEITEQVHIDKGTSVLLLGDGKLAQLIARVLNARGCSITAVGKHQWKLDLLRDAGVEATGLDQFKPALYDVVVEASGSPAGFELGLSCVRPRGTFVLKSTYAGSFQFNPASVVVNEITMVGSRCGRFSDALRFLSEHKPDLSKLITARYSLDNAVEAFAASQAQTSMKIVVECGK